MSCGLKFDVTRKGWFPRALEGTFGQPDHCPWVHQCHTFSAWSLPWTSSAYPQCQQRFLLIVTRQPWSSQNRDPWSSRWMFSCTRSFWLRNYHWSHPSAAFLQSLFSSTAVVLKPLDSTVLPGARYVESSICVLCNLIAISYQVTFWRKNVDLFRVCKIMQASPNHLWPKCLNQCSQFVADQVWLLGIASFPIKPGTFKIENWHRLEVCWPHTGSFNQRTPRHLSQDRRSYPHRRSTRCAPGYWMPCSKVRPLKPGHS